MTQVYMEIAVSQEDLNDLSEHANPEAEGSEDSQAIVHRGTKAKPRAVVVNWGTSSIYFYVKGA